MSFVWSYSALDCFSQCPKKFYHRYILREKEPPSPAMQRGIAIHGAIEKLLKRETAFIDPLLANFWPLIETVQRQAAGKKLMVEAKMGVLGNLEPCGFFDDHVFGRGAADVLVIDYPNAFLGDWKDGKADKPWSYVLKYEKRTQLAILALMVFKHFPRVEKITACNLWLEHGKPGPVYTFDRAGEAAGWLAVLGMVKQIEDAIAKETFCMIPGPLCGYCAVKSCPNNRT